jgi:hypothetical protein
MCADREREREIILVLFLEEPLLTQISVLRVCVRLCCCDKIPEQNNLKISFAHSPKVSPSAREDVAE